MKINRPFSYAFAAICVIFTAIAVSQTFAQPAWNAPGQQQPVTRKAPLPKTPTNGGQPSQAAIAALTTPLTPSAGYSGQALATRIDGILLSLRITTCAPRIKQVIIALSDNQNADFIFEPMSTNPNTATNVVTMESAFNDTSRLTIIHFNPDCGGTYEQTISWNNSCPDVKANFFPRFMPDRMIQKNITSYRTGNNLQLSLIPAGNGCVSVKKEMFR